MTYREPWGTTVFCDDIRVEAGNKVSLIGVYSGNIHISGPFPYVFPKFGMWVKYFEAPGAEQEDGKLFVWFPGNPSPFEMEPPLKQLREAMKTIPSTDDPSVDRWMQLQIPILLSPLSIREPGVIKVRIMLGKREIRTGAIQVVSSVPSSG